MKRWGLRHRGFRVGFIGIVVSSVFYVIGFASPAWRNTTGLWMSCSQEHKLCAVRHSSNSAADVNFPAWFDAVRALECLGLIGILLCIAAEVYMDFLSQPFPDKRLVELLALIGGTCGLVGSIIFAAYTPMMSSRNFHYNVYLSWGFGLSTASSCFIVAFASVIAFFRRKGLDVASYNASNAVHYRASDGVVIPQGMDLGPPAYSEVVSQPGGGGQGTSGSGPSLPHTSSQFAYFKPPVPFDSQPPPAYYPPPPSGQFQAPPPYTIIPASSVLSPGQTGSGQPSASEPVPVPPPEMNAETNQPFSEPAQVSSENSSDTASPPPVSLGTDPGVTGSPVVSPVPAYYVTVLGQMVPVFHEELQQAGRDVPSVGSPVPAYFIVTQGQHVPVYSEEQARALTN